MNKKVIITIMSSNNMTYQILEDTIKKTWFNDKNDDVEIIFYKESENIDKPFYQCPTVYLPCKDGLFNCGHKTLMAFDWILNNFHFDYLYRSNLGAYVDIKNILNFLDEKPKKNFYCGIWGEFINSEKEKINYASGSGYFLSKDLVDLVVKNKQLWNHSLIDDISLGDLLYKQGVKINDSALRKNICDDKIFYQKGNQIVDFLNEKELYHIRLRSDNRNLDIQNMINIYKLKND